MVEGVTERKSSSSVSISIFKSFPKSFAALEDTRLRVAVLVGCFLLVGLQPPFLSSENSFLFEKALEVANRN